jgi:hypothetical protein
MVRNVSVSAPLAPGLVHRRPGAFFFSLHPMPQRQVVSRLVRAASVKLRLTEGQQLTTDKHHTLAESSKRYEPSVHASSERFL